MIHGILTVTLKAGTQYILNVYKEKGYTSHDVVAKLRGITGQKKIGHTGTLDPDASGVLPICLGRATKLCGMLTDKDKCYETVMLLGMETDTQDITGRVQRRGDISKVTEDMIQQAVKSFEGIYEQIPPMYSALKVNGRKLYELAREGKTVERKPRRVTIYKIDILKIDLPRVHMRVFCSKGTYIRTLCRDIGERLSCTACMEELVRMQVSDFVIKDSVTLSEIEDRKKNGTLDEIIIPVDQMFSDIGQVTVKNEWRRMVLNGGPFPEDGAEKENVFSDLERVRVYDREGRFIGVYSYRETEKIFTLVKMFCIMERD